MRTYDYSIRWRDASRPVFFRAADVADMAARFGFDPAECDRLGACDAFDLTDESGAVVGWVIREAQP